MKSSLISIGIALIILFGGCAEKKPPNVVFVLVDDLGWADLACYGSQFHDTPNLDRLAEEGILFTDAYAASPVCSPTRAALMTGKHPARINITDWIPGMTTSRAENPSLTTPEDQHNLPLTEKTIAEAFRENGYKTFFAGKWHLGEQASHWPKQHGFDINIGGNAWGSPGRFNSEDGYYSPYGNPQLSDGPEGEYLTDRLTTESIEFINQNQRDPFFIYLSYYTVHTPISGCEKYDKYYLEKSHLLVDSGRIQSESEHLGLTRINQSNPKYAAMVRSLDDNIGRLMTSLKSSGLEDNTVFVFTSDNGGLSTLRKPGPTSVRPLRAGKGWCYEGGIRVPLIVRFPQVIKPGGSSGQPVVSMDLYPTLLDLCGIKQNHSQHVDGESLIEFLKNPSIGSQEKTIVWHYPHYHGSTWRPGSAIRKDNWKLIEFYENEKIQLYNLAADPGEINDLSGDRKILSNDLLALMHKKLDAMQAKYPTKSMEGI